MTETDDPLEYRRPPGNAGDIGAYPEAMFEDGNPELIGRALGTVARRSSSSRSIERGMTSSYQFCLQARRGSSGVVGPTTPPSAGPRGPHRIAEQSGHRLGGGERRAAVPNRQQPPKALSPGRPADPPHKKPTFALRVTPSVSVMFIAFRDSRDVSLGNFLLVLEFPRRPGGKCVLRDRIPARRP